MSKSLNSKSLRERLATGVLAVTMSLSLAAFGCSTNQTMSAGEPEMARPAAGAVTPSMSTTPGSAGTSIPSMVSGGVDASVDAEAVLEANRGFEGRVLGPASPGDGTSQSMQMATGQYVPPAALINPTSTINSSVLSDGVGQTTAIVSGAGEGIGAAAGFTAAGVVTGTSAAATTGGTGLASIGNAGTTAAANANFGATGLSNTTATGLTNTTAAATNIAGGTNTSVSTGAAAAPSIASSVLASRTLGTSARLNTDLTAAARGAATTGGALTVNNNGLATTGVTTGSGSAVRVTNVGGRVVVTNQSGTTGSSTSGNNQ